MEYLAPPLKCLLEIQWSIENGESVRSAVFSYVRRQRDPFVAQIADWLVLRERGLDADEVLREMGSPYRRAIVAALDQGLSGLPILSRLHELTVETREACADQMDRHLARLPLVGLFPLLFLQFPAFLWLLLAPLIAEFHAGLGR